MEKKKKLKEPKVFTVESAKQTIPFVKRIVADIMESSRELRNIEKSLRLLNPLQKRKSIIDRKEELLKNQEEYYNKGIYNRHYRTTSQLGLWYRNPCCYHCI